MYLHKASQYRHIYIDYNIHIWSFSCAKMILANVIFFTASFLATASVLGRVPAQLCRVEHKLTVCLREDTVPEI